MPQGAPSSGPDVHRPDWFVEAISAASQTCEVEVDGAAVRSRCWGPPGAGVVLIHGGGAHARWWDHIAPLLATQRRVVAVDLTGHGDSDWRSNYSLASWAAEALAAAKSGGINGPPVVVGHSMGGWVAFTAAAEFGPEVAGVVAVDSPIPAVVASTPEEPRTDGPSRFYATAHEAMARFRTIPADPRAQPYALAHIAEHSITRRGTGWTWKCDPRVFRRRHPDPELLGLIRCAAALFRAEHGLVTTTMGAAMSRALGRRATVISLAGAGHHVMLDEPLSLVAGLSTLLASWQLSPSGMRWP